MTYEGRGTTKPGVQADDHCVIFTSDAPVYFPGENGITKAPLKMIPESDRSNVHRLDNASRLNFAKVYSSYSHFF